MSDSRKIDSAEETEHHPAGGFQASGRCRRNGDAPGGWARLAPWGLIAISVALWGLLPQAWALAVLPWLSGALLSTAGLYLHGVTREIGDRRYPTVGRSAAWSPVLDGVPAVPALASSWCALMARCWARRRLCVAGWVTRLAILGGPVLAILLWFELSTRPSLPLAGFVWALCVGGLALSIAIGELIRDVLREFDELAR